MDQATLNQLVGHITGANVTGFFLVLARITPMFVLAPIFSSKMMPPRVRGIVAIALTMGLAPVAMHGQQIPGQPLEVLGLIVKELLVGFAFAFAIAALFAAIQMAAALTDAIAGFSFAGMIDPLNGNQGGVMTTLYNLVGLMLFIAIGGDAWMLRGLARTFQLVPLTSSPRVVPLVGNAVSSVGSVFTSALEVAAPAILALIITDVAFGMVSRVVPQLNVFAVGFPVKTGVALLIVAASLPFLGGWISDQVATSIGGVLHALQVA
jgi:flagellar biosynthesis protein FliR